MRLCEKLERERESEREREIDIERESSESFRNPDRSEFIGFIRKIVSAGDILIISPHLLTLSM